MRSSGSDVLVTGTPEDTKVIVTRRGTEEGVVRSRSRGSSGRKVVEQVGGGVETLRLYDIVRGAIHPLNLAVLARSVWTRHAELNTPREKGAGGVIIELTPVVALDSLDGETELSGHLGKEVEEGGKSLGVDTQRKTPRVVREIIDHHQIILIARKARNRGSP
jgi:hypothetical protein